MTDGPPPAPTSAAPFPDDRMPSLARLVRGLSGLFWGLPVTLLVCFHTARADFLRPLAAVFPVLCTAWLLYALMQVGGFEKRQRFWQKSLDYARVLALINLGLSPFLFWHNRLPGHEFFLVMVHLLAMTGLLFLAAVNVLLRRLGSMLPDETLRKETRQFTAVNLNLLLAMLLVTITLFTLGGLAVLPEWLQPFYVLLERGAQFTVIPLLLFPLATTMALLWKTKEVILDSVFQVRSGQASPAGSR